MIDQIEVLIADDHPIARNGLRFSIEADPGLKVIAEAGDGESALQLIRTLSPDIALLDVDMPKLDGLSVAREISKLHLNLKIIFLTLHDDETLFRQAIGVGARGYLLKDSAMLEIATGIRAVIAGKPYYSSAMTAQLLEDRASETGSASNPITGALTPTERRVLHLIAEGQSSKEIGALLSLHYRTVENHRTNISRKLKIDGSNSLLRFALQNRAML